MDLDNVNPDKKKEFADMLAGMEKEAAANRPVVALIRPIEPGVYIPRENQSGPGGGSHGITTQFRISSELMMRMYPEIKSQVDAATLDQIDQALPKDFKPDAVPIRQFALPLDTNPLTDPAMRAAALKRLMLENRGSSGAPGLDK